jgi:hypothetical protein
MVWVQGEADASDLTRANAYSVNVTSFLAHVRSTLGVTNLPVAVYRLHTNETDTYAAAVRTAQNNATNLWRVGIINVDDQTMIDGQHLDRAGQDALGLRAFDILTNFWSISIP